MSINYCTLPFDSNLFSSNYMFSTFPDYELHCNICNVSNVNLENTSPITSIDQCFKSGKCLYFAQLYSYKAIVKLSFSAKTQVMWKRSSQLSGLQYWCGEWLLCPLSFLCNTYCQLFSFVRRYTLISALNGTLTTV